MEGGKRKKGKRERKKEGRKRERYSKGKGKEERTKRTPPFLAGGTIPWGVGARGTGAYIYIYFMQQVIYFVQQVT